MSHGRSKGAERRRRQRKACKLGQKKKFASKEVCENLLLDLAKRKNVDVSEINSSIYHCAYCEWWHISRGKGPNHEIEDTE